MRKQSGFTLAELTVTMLVIGVLAAVAIPRLFAKNEFSARAAHDFIASSTRYAQKSAIAMRRNVCIALSGSTMTITYASAAGSDQACLVGNTLTSPANGQPFGDVSNALPGGSTVASASGLIFNASGRPLSSPSTAMTTPLTINVNGYPLPVTIEPETGLVH